MQINEFKKEFRVPEIVVYQHVNFEGHEFRTNLPRVNDIRKLTTIFFPTGVITTLSGGNYPQAYSQLNFGSWNMNDQISSIIVVSGKWQMYKHNDLKQKLGPVLSPGYYPWVGNIDIQNDQISSFECVERVYNKLHKKLYI